MRSCDLNIYLMNTGWVGGGDGDEGAKKVKIPHSSAVVKAIADGTITWERDPDFGYEIATSLPGFDDVELLQPRLLYERQGRSDEYLTQVERLRTERKAFLAGFAGLETEILATVG
jgi:phosphoenolpyruvate carboxykinase (ATP)